MKYCILALALVACKPSPAVQDAGTFALELESCYQRSDDCEQFVACQHKVQAKYGQPIEGSCTLSDAGKDGN